tara:strand:+ start:366 stop:662 length:297 start_codon:yes stop_codon:yes gene_type:complete
MATYTVTVKDVEGVETTVECDDDQTILDVVEEAGADAPYSCRAGSCSSCAGKLIEGTVDQEDQFFLDEEQLEKGYILTCVAKPTSNVIIQLGEEENLY